MNQQQQQHQSGANKNINSNNGNNGESLQNNNNNNNQALTVTQQRNSRSTRRKELESVLRNPKSLISIDGLLDGITALVLDCEPMRKNKNIENFLNRCMIPFLPTPSRLISLTNLN
jgi:hypothetical protein